MGTVIRDLQAQDRPAVAALLDDAVGMGFWHFADGEGALALVAVTDGEIVGALIAALRTTCEPEMREAVATVAPNASAAAVLHIGVVAVDPEVRRAGLARRLFASAERAARERGARAACLYAWLPAGRPEPAAVPFYEAAGYTAGADLPDFYAEDSVASNAWCPYCGAPPCRCAARPFAKALDA